MRRTLTALAAPAAIAAVALAGCGGSGGDTGDASGSNAAATTGGVPAGTIHGAGSTLGQPIYQQWGASTAEELGIRLDYAGVGSGAGVAQLVQKTADFGATDPALSDDDIAAARKSGSAPLHVPTVFGAITVSYNLAGVKTGLKLDGKTIADIFQGKLKAWNAPEIAKLNAGVSLPSAAIRVCHRSDESGTTKGFTEFLSDSSPGWKQAIGSDKAVKWPVGSGAQGNQGVAACVKQSAGAVGYVEQAYALQNGFTFAAVENSSGRFVNPTIDSVSAAGDGLDVPADLRFSAIGSPNPKAYPIVSQTFVVVYRDMCKAGYERAGAQRVQKFLEYGLGDGGQAQARQLSYAPLPSSLRTKALANVERMECDGQPLAG